MGLVLRLWADHCPGDSDAVLVPALLLVHDAGAMLVPWGNGYVAAPDDG